MFYNILVPSQVTQKEEKKNNEFDEQCTTYRGWGYTRRNAKVNPSRCDSALIPVALSLFYDANTTGWDADVITIWGLIPIFVVLGLALYFIMRSRR